MRRLALGSSIKWERLRSQRTLLKLPGPCSQGILEVSGPGFPSPGSSGPLPFEPRILSMTVLIYVDTRKQIGDPNYLKVFAVVEAAATWFAEDDPEGVTFEYDFLG